MDLSREPIFLNSDQKLEAMAMWIADTIATTDKSEGYLQALLEAQDYLDGLNLDQRVCTRRSSVDTGEQIKEALERGLSGKMKSRDEMIKRFEDLARYSMLERERSRSGRQYHQDLILALDLAIKYLREDGE